MRPAGRLYLLNMGNDTPLSERRLGSMINYQGWNTNVRRALDKWDLGPQVGQFVVPCYSGRQADDLVPEDSHRQVKSSSFYF